MRQLARRTVGPPSRGPPSEVNPCADEHGHAVRTPTEREQHRIADFPCF